MKCVSQMTLVLNSYPPTRFDRFSMAGTWRDGIALDTCRCLDEWSRRFDIYILVCACGRILEGLSSALQMRGKICSCENSAARRCILDAIKWKREEKRCGNIMGLWGVGEIGLEWRRLVMMD
jgi:hypothetical protein